MPPVYAICCRGLGRRVGRALQGNSLRVPTGRAVVLVVRRPPSSSSFDASRTSASPLATSMASLASLFKKKNPEAGGWVLTNVFFEVVATTVAFGPLLLDKGGGV